MSNPLHLAFAINSDYIRQLRVLWASLFEHHKKGSLHFHILYTGLSLRQQYQLRAIASRHHVPCDFHDIPHDWIKNLPVKEHIRFSPQYHRLFLAEFIPPEITRVLYLDSDTMVCRNLTDLVTADLHGSTVGAVEDLDVKDSCERLGIPLASGYFNSGVLVIDMRLWVEQHVSSRVIEYLTTHRHDPARWKYPDQDALNTVLWQTRHPLPANWNMFACYRWFQPVELSQEQRSAILAPGIVHFTGPEKPWLSGFSVPYKTQYRRLIKLAGVHFPFTFSLKAIRNGRRQERILESMRRIHLAAGLGDDF